MSISPYGTASVIHPAKSSVQFSAWKGKPRAELLARLAREAVDAGDVFASRVAAEHDVPNVPDQDDSIAWFESMDKELERLKREGLSDKERTILNNMFEGLKREQIEQPPGTPSDPFD